MSGTHEGAATVPEARELEYESYYAAPRAAVGVPGVFRARTWYRWLIVLVFGGFAALFLGMAIFQTTVGIERDGSDRDKAAVVTAMGLCCGAVAGLGAVPLVARRGPVLRACREGLEVRLFGRSTAYGVPSAPGFVRLAWALVSGGGCRFPVYRIPWEELGGVLVRSRRWERILTIHRDPGGGREGCWVVVPQSEVVADVDRVARQVLDWAGDGDAREALPGWEDPE